MDLKEYIRSIPDYPKKGILFRDITTLIKDKNAFKSCIDKIAAIESRGFIFSSPLSYIVNKPIVLLRKENKLPADKYSVDFTLEYGTTKLEVHKDSVKKNEKILIVDDLIATGGTANAAVQLVALSGGKVSGFIFVINLFDLGGQDKLKKNSYFIESLINFPGH